MELELVPKVKWNLNKIKSGKRIKTVLKRERIMSVDYTNKHATRGGGTSRNQPEWSPNRLDE